MHMGEFLFNWTSVLQKNVYFVHNKIGVYRSIKLSLAITLKIQLSNLLLHLHKKTNIAASTTHCDWISIKIETNYGLKFRYL